MGICCRPKRASSQQGFSLVEVALSLGIVAFVLVTITALLPVGMKANQESSNEVQASGLISALEADLRNTYPSVNSGKSQIFGIVLPYTVDGAGVVSLNTSLSLTAVNSVGISDKGAVVSLTATPPPLYQVSVLYTAVPAASTSSPTQARLIVSWPCLKSATATQLTSNTNVKGYVEAYVTFPAP